MSTKLKNSQVQEHDKRIETIHLVTNYTYNYKYKCFLGYKFTHIITNKSPNIQIQNFKYKKHQTFEYETAHYKLSSNLRMKAPKSKP